MLFDTPIITEGSAIINTTVESGSAYPPTANSGEIFFRTDLNDFVFRGISSWNQYAPLIGFNQHAANMNLHLTSAEKTLVSGITVPASEINSIPQMKLDITAGATNLNTHAANMSLHLTAAQNTFLDALNLPTLTGANVNTLVGQTVLLTTQFANQTAATALVQTNLNTHANNLTIHVTPAQNAWLGGIDMVKITPAIINSLDTIVAGGTAANKVAKTGDTMSGVLNMGGNKITGVAAATVDSDAANKKYVDDKVAAFVPDLSAYVKKAGDTMTGDLNMSSRIVTGMKAPVGPTDGTNKKYVDDLAAGKLSIFGGILKGAFFMDTFRIVDLGNPVDAGDAVNKGFLTTEINSVRNVMVLKTGDTMSGALNMNSNAIQNIAGPALPGDAANKGYVDLRLLKSGDTMSGQLTMGGNKVTSNAVPTGNGDLTNKKYVDDAITAATSQPGPAVSAAKLTNARDFFVTGGAVGKTNAKFDGTSDATINITQLNASTLNGQIPATSLTDLGLSYVSRILTATDFNTVAKIEDVGFYSVQSSTPRTNGPNPGTFAYNGVLHVIRRGEAATAHSVTQILYANQTCAIRFASSSGAVPNETYSWSLWTYLTSNALGAGVDLDTLLVPGEYHQVNNTNAASGQNYPSTAARAGTLTVTAAGPGIINQTYQIYGSGTLVASGNTYGAMFTRSYYSTSAAMWSPWRRIMMEGGEDVVTLTGAQTIAGEKTFSDRLIVSHAGNATFASASAISTAGGVYAEKDGNFGHSISRGNLEVRGNSFELGRTDIATSAYIDFHSSGTMADYDSRIWATGGNGTVRQGQLELIAGGGITLTGPVTAANGITGLISSATALQTARTFSISGGATAAGVGFNGTGNVVLNVTSLNAPNLTGVVPNAAISGVYDGISVKLNGTNVVFTTPSPGTASGLAATVYGLAEYRNSTSNTTGAIAFYAPLPSTAAAGVMYLLEYTMRLHSPAEIIKGSISAYRTSPAGGWSAFKHVSTGTTTPMVRVANDAAGKPTFIFGDVGTVWSHPHITLSLAMASHTGFTEAAVMGWTTGLVTNLTGFGALSANIATSPIDTKVVSATVADTANTLTTTRQINGTNFNGAGNIITANWGTYRNLTIGSTAKSVNGAVNVAWSLAEIGAASASNPVFSGTFTNGGTQIVSGSAGSSWINGTNGTKGVAANALVTASSGNQYHSWFSQITNAGNAYGMGILGTDFFITSATKAAVDAGANNVTNVLKYEVASGQVQFPAAVRLVSSAEAQLFLGASAAYLYGNAANIGFYRSTGSCAMTNTSDWSVSGNVFTVKDVVAFYSDERLKENIRPIMDALGILRKLDGVRYNANALAGSFGFDMDREQIGLKAQQVKDVLPELIERAPFDLDDEGKSKSGEDYMTVKYDRVIPVLVEGIKQLDAENARLKEHQANLEARLARLEELLLG